MTNKPTIFSNPKSSWWWYSWYTGEGERIRASLKFLNLSQNTHTADEALDVLLAFLGMRPPAPDASQGYTLGYMLHDMPRRLEREGIREGTIASYSRSIGKLASYLGHDCMVKDVTKIPHVAGLKTSLLDQGVSPVTVNQHLRGLQTCFNRLLEDGTIPSNPFNRFKRLKRTGDKPAHLTAEQVYAFLDAITRWKPSKPKLRPTEIEAMKRLMYLYLYTGRRRAEIPRVKRSDIDTVHWTVYVPNVKKRGISKDLIVIPKPVREDVRWFLDTFRGDFPFRFCAIETISRYAKRWMRLAGLPESLHLHSLRHTAITLWIEAGISPRTIQDYVGHSSILITEGYVHGKRQEDMTFGHDFKSMTK